MSADQFYRGNFEQGFFHGEGSLFVYKNLAESCKISKINEIPANIENYAEDSEAF